MKTKNFIALLMVTMLVIFPVFAQKSNSNKATVVFNVAMDCHSCQQKIEKNIAFEKGVKALDVSLQKQTVQVTYDTRRTTVEKLQEAFKKIGYEAKVNASEEKKGCCATSKS
ncbi:MAG: heavy metal-associated domain-containing protein [Paludibacter sp.]|nr:heavy metal-associated domain-containing protein [Paludibacter sp.]